MRKGRVALQVAGAVIATSVVAITVRALQAYTTPPISLLMLPIIGAAYFGRLPSGLAATVAGSIWALVITEDIGLAWLRPLTVLVIGATMSLAIEALHRSRMQTEAERRDALDSKNRFSRVFYSSPTAMCLTRIDDRTVAEINAAYSNLFGPTQSQIIGRTPESAGLVFQPGAREALFDKMRVQGWIRDEPLVVETRCGRREITVSSQLVDLEGVKYSIATFLDMTERRRAEREASESQTRLRELAENVQEVFFVWSADGKNVEYMSPAYERVFGRSLARLERDPTDWLQAVHHDDRPRLLALLGKPFDARHDDSFRIVLPDGTVRNLRTTFFPIRDADGAIVRIGGVTSDITQELHLEEQVRQSQKLESLGLLAGGVAHDFNNILAVIGSNVGMLGEVVPAGDADLVDEIEKAVTRGAGLTRQLLAFSRRQVIEPVVLDVNKVVEETRKMLRRMVGEDVHLSCSLDPELHPVVMDAGALVQVLMNLAVNARDAMPRGGTLTMITRNVGNDVVLEVTDTGCGMSHEVVSRIFEPFFTTKGAGKGTGLGLSVVHGIVEQSGGRIEVSSQVGAGTTFSIHVPASASELAVNHRDHGPDYMGHETILLVDDDMFVRTSAARALRTKGYTVLEAGDGAEALGLLTDPSIALLVTDVVMPGMDGRQLVDAARAHRPSLPVLYTSGYTDDAVLQHGIQHLEVAFLEKPFRTRQLAGCVRRLLDEPHAQPMRWKVS